MSDGPTHSKILLCAGVAALTIPLLWWLTVPQRPAGVPPGPGFALPFLGHLLFVRKDPRLVFRRWRREYGDLFSLFIGTRLVVVLNGYRVFNEALVNNEEAFTDRICWKSWLVGHGKQRFGIFDRSGPMWQSQRTATAEILDQLELTHKIREEVTEYVKAIATKNGHPFDIKRLTQISVCNNICSILLGKRFNYDDPTLAEFMTALQDFLGSGSVAVVTELMPITKVLPWDSCQCTREMAHIMHILHDFIKPIVDKHIEEYGDNDDDDFIDAYLTKSRKCPLFEKYLNEFNLPRVILDLFASSVEYISTAICWAVVFFLHHPEVQERCYKELMNVVGNNRHPRCRDRDSLTYVQATILEVLRMANVAPLAVPHRTSCDAELLSYEIPAQTIVFLNMDSVVHDPAVWGDPDKFRPERFIGKDGQIVKPAEFIPFSIGRRACLGESLAETELYLYIATMIQHFRFRLPDKEKLPGYSGTMGFIHKPGKFKVCAEVRHPKHICETPRKLPHKSDAGSS